MWQRRLLIDGGVEPGQLSNVGTHSLKATLLSSAAKAGLPTGARTILGYHVKPSERSVLEYSRDEFGEPLRLLGNLLQDVGSGRFLPDATRSGRWVLVGPDPSGGSPMEASISLSAAPEQPVREEATDEQDSSEGDSVPSPRVDGEKASSSGSSSAPTVSPSEGMTDDVAEPVPSHMPAASFDHRLFVHFRLNTLHRGRDGDIDKLACGRRVVPMYRQVTEGFGSAMPCVVCFGVNVDPADL